jgi:hypothetical protein
VSFQVPDISSRSRIIQLNSASIFKQPAETIMDCLKDEMGKLGVAPQPHCGLLKLAPLITYSGKSRDVSEAQVRLHAVISHECYKQFGFEPEVPTIGDVRMCVGVFGESSARAKGDLIELFKRSVSDRDEVSTKSALQTLSESWAVAMYLERKRLLAEIRTSWPEVVERARNHVKLQKLYQRDERVKISDELIDELVDAQVDKMLTKRFFSSFS